MNKFLFNKFFNTSNKLIIEKNIKDTKIENQVKSLKNYKIVNKIKVLGNFFKLKLKKKKKITTFNLCLAHKIFFYVNTKKANITIKKIKKNKLLILRSMLTLKKCTNSQTAIIHYLKFLRPVNPYTKKGIKLNLQVFKQKTGKKTTYA